MHDTLIGDDDVYLFNEGRHLRLFDRLGAHLKTVAGQAGCHFAVWAPNAAQVAVIGDFNGWQRDDPASQLTSAGGSGIFGGFIAGARHGQRYKYAITSQKRGYRVDKADPLAFFAETPPSTGSIIWDLDYAWQDGDWMATRARHNRLDAPMSIYEVHLGSWMRLAQEGNRPLSYRELAPRLCEYVTRLGFTHVELLPVMEHPFYGSWGYQVTGFFAPTSRYGSPQDLMFLVDELHRSGIGVIFDWVPSHFPSDEHGLGFFDGTHLYEHEDPRQGVHPDWKSLLFNYSRNEVRSFLLSSAMFWLERYHADGLRVDGVASMLYLDYSRKTGEWVPNRLGGRENLDAVHFLRSLNEDIYRAYPDGQVQVIAEESTSWPKVTRPTSEGGLGFGLKWDMGWMHDTLKYMARDPVHRRYHHSSLTFRMMYAYSENFVLALSHDEVVHLKGSLYNKMAGDDWQRRANLRLMWSYMYGLPGKKLSFMGCEFGQLHEWNHEASLDWHLLELPEHAGLLRFTADLNHLYQREPALSELDYDRRGFLWLEPNDSAQSALGFLRIGKSPRDVLLIACNFTPMPRANYCLGVPLAGDWCEVLNSDATIYGGSGQGNLGRVTAEARPYHNQPASLTILLPPLAAVIFKPAS